VEDVSDQAIWAGMLGGDAASFGLIWDRHRHRVLRHLLALGAASFDADDLAAVAFLELWRRRAVVRFVDGSVLPWLLVTAQNVHRNAARAKRRHLALLHRLPIPADEPDPADSIAERDSARAQALRAALAAVRPTDQHLIVLTMLEGFTVGEAAAAVGLSESAARMRLSRARARLRVAVEGSALEGGAL